jgi:hypothetical protein
MINSNQPPASVTRAERVIRTGPKISHTLSEGKMLLGDSQAVIDQSAQCFLFSREAKKICVITNSLFFLLTFF